MNGPCLLWRCVQHDQSALTFQVSDPCKWCPGYGGGPVPVPALLDKTWHPPPWTSPGRHMQRGGWVRQAVRTRYQQPLWTNAVTDKGYYFDTQGESWQTPLKKNANFLDFIIQQTYPFVAATSVYVFALTSLESLVKRSPPLRKSRIKYNFPSVWNAANKQRFQSSLIQRYTRKNGWEKCLEFEAIRRY